jgi:hypothetical protein
MFIYHLLQFNIFMSLREAKRRSNIDIEMIINNFNIRLID